MKHALLAIFIATTLAHATESKLWYEKPATRWEQEALPIGNGRLGAMIFGGVERERIQFNEDSLWIGDETDTGAYQAFGDLFIDFELSTHNQQVTDRCNDAYEELIRISHLETGWTAVKPPARPRTTPKAPQPSGTPLPPGSDSGIVPAPTYTPKSPTAP